MPEYDEDEDMTYVRVTPALIEQAQTLTSDLFARNDPATVIAILLYATGGALYTVSPEERAKYNRNVETFRGNLLDVFEDFMPFPPKSEMN